MPKNVYLLLLILLVSCSQLEQPAQVFESVNLNLDKKEDIAQPDLNLSSGVGQYGPAVDREVDSKRKSSQTSYAVILGPGLNKSVMSLELLSCLSRFGQKVNIVSGIGFSSVIAALYAQGNSAEEIKWKLYKVMRKLKKESPFGQRWKMEWTSFIEDNIDEKIIKKSSISLWLPLWEDGKINYTSKINIKEYLKTTLDDRNKNNVLKKPFLNKEIKNKMPVDTIIYSNVLAQGVSFQQTSGYLYGLYTKASQWHKGLKDDIKIVDIDSKDSLDSVNLTAIWPKHKCVEFSKDLISNK